MSDESAIFTDFERKTISTLEGIRPKFLTIRDIISVGDQVGFGTLPECHLWELSAAISTRVRPTNQGILIYQKPIFMGSEPRLLACEERNRLVVPADLTKPNPYIVSIFDKLIADDRSFAELTSTQIEGYVAHELVHWRISYGEPLPRDMIRIIQRREQDLQISPQLDRHSITTSEIDVDILTSLFGFKDHTLDVGEMLLNRLEKLRRESNIPVGHIASWKSEIESRISQVVKYT